MVSTQPVFSLKYFRLIKNSVPKGIKELFYLSWEDALWDILIKKNIKKGSTILIPDFYCTDVEENIRKHGYKIAHYKIKSDLGADKKSFASSVLKYKPSVIVIFHPVGIKSNLLNKPGWLIKTAGDSILIEDAVHRVLDTKDFTIIKNNHFIMDSLRKVVPIQGARLFGRTEDLDFEVPPIFQSYFYSLKVRMLWFLMTLSWTLGVNLLAEILMIKGYGLIGDSTLPTRGSMIGKFFSSRLNIIKIQKLKEEQADYYESALKRFLPMGLSISKKDKKHLRGYPVILPKGSSQKVVTCLRNGGLMVRFELDDSEWSRNQKIIYLPLGIYMSKKQQIEVCHIIQKCLRKI